MTDQQTIQRLRVIFPQAFTTDQWGGLMFHPARVRGLSFDDLVEGLDEMDEADELEEFDAEGPADAAMNWERTEVQA